MNELADSKKYSFDFYSGETSEIEIAKLAESDFREGLLCTHLVNHWYKNLLWQSGLYSKVVRSEYDSYIFLGSPYFISTWIWALWLKYIARKKVYFWTHGTLGRGAKRWLKKIFFRIPDGLLLYGNFARDELIRAGLPERRLSVIYNSLDFKTQEEKYRLYVQEGADHLSAVSDFASRKKNYFVFIGRLTPQKKIDLAVRALSKMDSDVGMIIIGDGQERQRLEWLVDELDVRENVLFLGECSEEDIIAPIFVRAIGCVSPGNVGLTAMHSLQYGVPVVTHSSMEMQMPEAEAVVEGRTGFLFRRGDEGSLVLAMTRCVRAVNENPLIRRLCREKVAKLYSPLVQRELIERALDDN